MPRKINTEQVKKRRAPARTLEARENQLIELAVNLAEQQLIAGTASAQVITHYLKLGSTTERLENEKRLKETELLIARSKQIESSQKIEDLYLNALNAMRDYGGNSPGGDNKSNEDTEL